MYHSCVKYIQLTELRLRVILPMDLLIDTNMRYSDALHVCTVTYLSNKFNKVYSNEGVTPDVMTLDKRYRALIDCTRLIIRKRCIEPTLTFVTLAIRSEGKRSPNKMINTRCKVENEDDEIDLGVSFSFRELIGHETRRQSDTSGTSEACTVGLKLPRM